MPQQVSLFEQRQNWNFGRISEGGGVAGKIIRGKSQLGHTYNDIISLENLCLAWEEFVCGKKNKRDVIKFSRNLMDNIVELHDSLVNHTYQHGGYESFYINDPKRRHIHKASVRDRLLHHAVYRILYPFFDKTFIADSFSCRDDKGMHRAINRFRKLANKESHNHRRTVWVLKCDIKKFFASIDHEILINILEQYIPDKDIVWLLKNIISSFNSRDAINRVSTPVGLPLGNLTSQLFANVYLNVFDQWVKYRLVVETPGAGVFGAPTTGQRKTRYQRVFTTYIRYADDFVFVSHDRAWLESIVPRIKQLLCDELGLILHPGKIFLKTIASGIDFLGWVHFSDHRVLRTKTKQRMFRNIKNKPHEESLQSYFGLLNHGNTRTLRERVAGEYWLWR